MRQRFLRLIKNTLNRWTAFGVPARWVLKVLRRHELRMLRTETAPRGTLGLTLRVRGSAADGCHRVSAHCYELLH